MEVFVTGMQRKWSSLACSRSSLTREIFLLMGVKKTKTVKCLIVLSVLLQNYCFLLGLNTVLATQTRAKAMNTFRFLEVQSQVLFSDNKCQ